MRPVIFLLILVCYIFGSCREPVTYEVLIRNGKIIDGSGKAGYFADLAINGDTIAAIGKLHRDHGILEIDAEGLVVAPGFINMLSWANESLIEDGRSQSDIRQGVTLEVLGEGESMGPLNDWLKEDLIESQQHIKYDVTWTTLGEYLEFLEHKGVSPNIASFVGNATLRLQTIGFEKRLPAEDELAKMKSLLRQSMEEGAVGMSTALIYVPSGHAQTEEIIELAKIVAEYDGMYISHIRSEETELIEAVKELITIAEKAKVRSEIYHFKASGTANWHLLDEAISLIEGARANGLPVTTDMYMYNASSTGLNVVLPQWAKDGGHEETMKLIESEELSRKMMNEIDFHVPPEKILLVGFRNEKLRHLTGKTLAEVASARNTSPERTILDLIYEDDSRIQVIYFSMSEDNIKKKVALPYMSVCSDAGSYATEGVFLEFSTHPRAYGSFARLLGKYVREEKIISLEEAIRKLSGLPAANLKIDKRGILKEGYYADVVLFDAEKIKDNATFQKPHQYATGMKHVFVNGTQVLKDGEHTGALPGRVVRGPGWLGYQN